MVVAAGLTDVNFALSFWTALTFLILLVVLGKFAWGPILQMLETRERNIAEAIESAKRDPPPPRRVPRRLKPPLGKRPGGRAGWSRQNSRMVPRAKAGRMSKPNTEAG